MESYIHILVVIIMILVDGIKVSGYNLCSKNRKIIIYVILLALYGGLRSPLSMVDDYATEFLLFQRLSFSEIFQEYATREPVYRCFVKVLGMISTNVQILYLVQASVISICFGMFVNRRSIDPLVSFVVFLTLRDYSFCLAAMRQGLAIAIIIGFADMYLERKQVIKFIVSVVIASLFHTSALLFIILYPCYHRIRNTKVFAVIMGCIAGVFLASGGLLSSIVSRIPFLDKYDAYVQSEYHQGGIQTTLIIYFLLVVFMVFGIKNKKEKQSKEERALTFGVGLELFGNSYGAISRGAFYFTGYSTILFPKALVVLPKYDKVRVLFLAFLLIQYVVFGPGQGGANYHFFWNLS